MLQLQTVIPEAWELSIPWIKENTFREFFDSVQKGRSHIVAEGGTIRHLTKEICSWIEPVFSMDRHTRKDLDFTTNVSSFDRLINLFANEKIRESPRIKSLIKSLFQNFSRSGLPAYMYMRSEKPLVSKIEKVVNLIT